MKELLNKLLESLHLNGRDFAVFLLALLLAFSIWLIHNLSLRYNEYLDVTVVARCNIEGHSDVSSNRCDVTARCRARGYRVVTSKIRKGRTVEVQFSPSVMKHLANDTYYLTSADLMEYTNLIFGNDVTVDYFVSDTLYFKFPVIANKKVPVHPVFSISYKKQYMSRGPIEFVPDSITVYGERFLLDNISEVFTRPIKQYDLSSDVKGVVQLEKLKGIRLSDQEIRYSIGVTRFVEIRDMVPVTVTDLPIGKEILVMPSEVELSMRCAFPLEGDPLANVSLSVSYDDVVSSLSGKCMVRVDSLPKGVLNYATYPSVVQCLEER